MKSRQGPAAKRYSQRASGLRTAGALVAAVVLVTAISDPLLAAIDPSDGVAQRPSLKLWSVAQTTAPPAGAAQDAIVPPVRREAPQAPAAPAPEAKPTQAAPPTAPPVKKPETAAAPKVDRTPPEFSGVFGTIQEWLARANREYQGVVVKELSLPQTQPTAGADDAIARKLEQQQQDDAKKAAAAKRADDEARQASEAKAAAAAKTAEAKKLDEDKKRAEETKRLADEAKKKADEVLKTEQAAQPKPAPAKPEVAQPAAPAPKVDDAAAAQKAREAEQREAQRLADEAKRQEQARQEQVKLEQARQEQARQEQVKQEQARQDQAKRAAETERKAAADRAAKADAERRRAVETPQTPRQSSRTIVLTPEPIARPDDPGTTFRPEMARRRTATQVAAETSVQDEPAPQRVTRRRIRVYHEASYRGLGGALAHTPQIKRWVWRADGRYCAGAGQQITPPARYTIKRGDSLWRISERHYHDGRLYPKIHRANRATIADPDLIYPCQRVMVPRKR